MYSAEVCLEPELNAWTIQELVVLLKIPVEASIRQPAYGTRNLNVIKELWHSSEVRRRVRHSLD